ncbi:hypothetical protein Taro_007232, partial [Colocasia esculenta]|nr:hypothetical protein [Colocasia esculenta]
MPPPCVSLSLSLRVLLWSGSNWCLARLLPSSPLQFSDQEVGDQRSSNWTVAAAGSGTPISPSSTGHRDVRYPRRQRAVAYLIDDTGMWGVRVGCFFRQEPLLRYERKGSSQVD